MVSSMSPAATLRPGSTATDATTPGIGAGTCRGLPSSALGRRVAVACAARLGAEITRGWPFSSKNTFTLPSSLVSPTADRRSCMVLPGSSSISISSATSMP